MSMDAFGRNPSKPCGQHFRASIWMWVPIHEQMMAHCGDLLDEALLRAMEFNEGAGPDDQETCTIMAERFEQALATYQDGFYVESDGLRVTEDGHFVSKEDRAKDPTLKTISPYHASRGLVMEWIDFLRHCGGFEVW